MADIEKVIKGIRKCLSRKPCHENGCPYSDECAVVHLNEPLLRDALELLKEQKAVEPHYNARTNWYECGVCHYSMTSGMHCRGELIPAYKVGFCAKCGQEVKWE